MGCLMQLTHPSLTTGWSIRELGPADRDRLTEGFRRLSPETRRRRYLGVRGALTEAELDLLTGAGPRAEPALAAVDADGDLIGVARVAPEPGSPDTVHIGLVVTDSWQGHGVGTALMSALAERERSLGVRHVRATTFADNRAVRHMLARAGAHGWHSVGGGVVEATVDLVPDVAIGQAA